LLTSISRDVLVQIAALPSAVAVRKHIEEAFVSQSHARAINTRMALVSTQKGSMTVAEYVSKMKSLANDMASAGKKLDDEEITSYILAGLDFEYNSANFILSSWLMRHGLIFEAKAPEGNLLPRSTLRRVVEGVSLEGMVTVALVDMVAMRLVDMTMATHPTSQEINILRAKCVERPTTRSSSVTSGLIPHTWVKRRMQMWQCLMGLIPIGMQIRVPWITLLENWTNLL
jgi:hypothetical protein